MKHPSLPKPSTTIAAALALAAAGTAAAATCIVSGDPIAASKADTSTMPSVSAPLVTGTLSMASDGMALRSDKVIGSIIKLR